MRRIVLRGRSISRGKAEGEALVSSTPISFFGGIDPTTGQIIEKSHKLKGTSVKGKILVFPTGKGSTVGSWTLYQLSKNGVAPKAIINIEAETVIAVGAIIGNIPLVDRLERNPLQIIETGDYVKVDGDKGIVEIIKATKR